MFEVFAACASSTSSEHTGFSFTAGASSAFGGEMRSPNLSEAVEASDISSEVGKVKSPSSLSEEAEVTDLSSEVGKVSPSGRSEEVGFVSEVDRSPVVAGPSS